MKSIILISIAIFVLVYTLLLYKKNIVMFTINSSYSLHCVVARYNEDVEWTRLLPDVFLYNKGNPVSLPSIVLPNVGREGHTYYHHIVTHYDDLPDAIVFLQANPFDHSPHLFTNLQTLFRNKPRLFSFLSEDVRSFDIHNSTSWHQTLDAYMKKLPSIPNDMATRIYTNLFAKPPASSTYLYGCGAQFMVSKRAILRHPKSFYQKICNLLHTSSNPVEGFVIERLHRLFFT